METEFVIKTLLSILVSFIKVNNFPLLVSTTIVTKYSNCCTFFIFASLNFNDLVVGPVDELVVLILEDLEPS
jgi:hypothetical protein